MEIKSVVKFAVVGSVDDGKSTLIGRLMYDSKTLYHDQAEQIKSEEDLAFITDGLKSEREQGITIDVAYRYFYTQNKKFIIIDTPGHHQYTRNMATGTSNTSTAVILLDAYRGITTQSKRHSIILTMFGVKKLIVCVNKMDMVDYNQDKYNEIVQDYSEFIQKISKNVSIEYLAISALKGDNVIKPSDKMPWSKTLIDILNNLTFNETNLIDTRLPIQGVIRPDMTFRGYTGRLSSGILREGEEIVVLPSMVKTKINTILSSRKKSYAFSPESILFTTDDDLDISRGNMIVKPDNMPLVSKEFDAIMIWMDEEKRLDSFHKYIIKHTTNKTQCYINPVYKIDPNTLHKSDPLPVELNDISRVRIKTSDPIFYDPYEVNRETGSFIIIDRISNKTVAAGIIVEKNANQKHFKPKTLWFTGLSGSGKTTIAKELNEQLDRSYIVDGDVMREGLCSNLGFSLEDRKENIRRIAEVCKIVNSLGYHTIVPVISPTREIRQHAREIIGTSFIEVYVSTSLEECERRDVKGLYKKARQGEIENFTGLSSPYEKPENPDIVLNTEDICVEDSVKEILSYFLNNK